MISTIRIYYSSLADPHYLECPCNNWHQSDYSIMIETILSKSQRDTLFNHITPGATAQLYQVLGKPYYYDKTWSGNNTLRLVPIAGTHLSEMFDEKIIYVNKYSDSIINKDWIAVKIEGFISGSSL